MMGCRVNYEPIPLKNVLLDQLNTTVHWDIKLSFVKNTLHKTFSRHHFTRKHHTDILSRGRQHKGDCYRQPYRTQATMIFFFDFSLSETLQCIILIQLSYLFWKKKYTSLRIKRFWVELAHNLPWISRSLVDCLCLYF